MVPSSRNPCVSAPLAFALVRLRSSRLLAAHFAQAQVGGSGKFKLNRTRQAGGLVCIVEPEEDVRAVGGEREELPYHLGLVGGRTGGDGHLLDPAAAPVEVTPGSTERGLEIVGAIGVHAVVNEKDLQQPRRVVQNPGVGQGDARVLVQHFGLWRQTPGATGDERQAGQSQRQQNENGTGETAAVENASGHGLRRVVNPLSLIQSGSESLPSQSEGDANMRMVTAWPSAKLSL